ncbi:ribokinase [Kallotenue papyrolyticum]|uniref:ribokinase n=1 Tax=Kallotenue papyrolyticum TaxID=1325125 RepID=UPI0004786255|nr:ribokinase [Kallotenue papyrolyticum]
MTQAAVVVVGSCNMDLVTRAPRLPLPGETISGTSFGTYLGGKGFNQAVAARRMGASVALVACIGADDFGRQVEAAARQEGIATHGLTRSATAPTGTALILVQEGSGENSIVIVASANAQLTPERVAEQAATLRAARVLLLQLEVPIEASLQAARLARAAGATVILTPAPVQPLPDELLRLSDILVPNAVELRQLAGDEHDLATAARQLLARGVGAVVITQGARGALCVTSAGEYPVAPFAVQAVDTTAAGDAFVGALAALLAEGWPLPEALRAASAAGALAVTRMGALPSLPTRPEVEAMLAGAATARP